MNLPELEPLPRRKRLRLTGYDYSQAGGYFITICTHGRLCLFGSIAEGEVIFNPRGGIVETEWLRTIVLRPNLILDRYVVMPNHFHAILFIDYPTLGHRQPDEPKQCLDRIVAGFKAACTRQINRLERNSIVTVWQRSYHDRIVRSERHLQRLRAYIENNPRRWEFDKEYRHQRSL